jgi:hypothetical protein
VKQLELAGVGHFEGYRFQLKGTGFSPYINRAKMIRGFSLEENFFQPDPQPQLAVVQRFEGYGLQPVHNQRKMISGFSPRGKTSFKLNRNRSSRLAAPPA